MPLAKCRSEVKTPQQLCTDSFSLMELRWLSRRSGLEKLCFPVVSNFLQREIGTILAFCNVSPSTKLAVLACRHDKVIVELDEVQFWKLSQVC